MRKEYFSSIKKNDFDKYWRKKKILPVLKVIFDSENFTSIPIELIWIEKSLFIYFDSNPVETNRNGKFD